MELKNPLYLTLAYFHYNSENFTSQIKGLKSLNQPKENESPYFYKFQKLRTNSVQLPKSLVDLLNTAQIPLNLIRDDVQVLSEEIRKKLNNIFEKTDSYIPIKKQVENIKYYLPHVCNCDHEFIFDLQNKLDEQGIKDNLSEFFIFEYQINKEQSNSLDEFEHEYVNLITIAFQIQKDSTDNIIIENTHIFDIVQSKTYVDGKLNNQSYQNIDYLDKSSLKLNNTIFEIDTKFLSLYSLNDFS